VVVVVVWWWCGGFITDPNKSCFKLFGLLVGLWQ
jgi:hypothetical protein